MRVSELLTCAALELRMVTAVNNDRLDHLISRCAPTEYLDPTPFIDPGVLVLTSGIGMSFTEQSVWDAYVERLASVPASALVFAIGPAHSHLPHALVSSCARFNIPLLESPASVPLLKIVQHVEDVLESERFQLLNQGWALAAECARLAAQGAEISTLLTAIHAAIQKPVAVFDGFGSIIAQYPLSVKWQSNKALKLEKEMFVLSLSMGIDNPCELVVQTRPGSSNIETLIAPVASILALHLNRSGILNTSSQLELRRFIDQCEAWSEASQDDVARAFRALHLKSSDETYLMVAKVHGGNAATAWQLRTTLHDSFQEVRITEFEGQLVALTQAPRLSFAAVSERFMHIAAPTPLIIHPATRSLDELRMAVVSALIMLRRVERPTIAPALGLPAIVAITAGRGAREAAEGFLAPLFQHDMRHGTDLARTMSVWLECDAHPKKTSERLFIHRNSLAYRLRTIERLLQVRLDSLDGQMTCALAVQLAGLEVP